MSSPPVDWIAELQKVLPGLSERTTCSSRKIRPVMYADGPASG